MNFSTCIGIFSVFLLYTNIDARPPTLRDGRQSNSNGRGRGGLGWAFSGHFGEKPSPFGKTFLNNGPPENSYISQNSFKYKNSSTLLSSSLFYGSEKPISLEDQKNILNSFGFELFHQTWNEHLDKKWRETTRAPYFENKIPIDDKIFPASAVIGAATAFGVTSLLPLNIPPRKPLMHCGTNLNQLPIRINNEDIYVCKNRNIEILCNKNFEHRECFNEKMQCDLPNNIMDNIYCSNRTLLSRMYLFCNSTSTVHYNSLNDNFTVINCYEGQLPRSQVAFIPTTSTTTEFSIRSTTSKPLSLKANLHIFLLKLMGKSHALETTTQQNYPYPDANAWHPEALTFEPESTTRRPKLTTSFPFK